jgi:hypothetical protein
MRRDVKALFTYVAASFLFLSAVVAQDARQAGIRTLVYGADTVAHCAAPVKALQRELPALQFPDGWTLGIVCNPIAWAEILQIADPPRTSSAFSNLIRHSTVLNAAIFRAPRAIYHHTLAHELGHATCNCSSEKTAEEFAVQYALSERQMATAHLGARTH